MVETIKCGYEINDINLDCTKLVKQFGTIDKIVYENIKGTIKGESIHTRGGFSPNNDLTKRKNISKYSINKQIPLIKKYYVYEIKYYCKNCGQLFKSCKEENIEPFK